MSKDKVKSDALYALLQMHEYKAAYDFLLQAKGLLKEDGSRPAVGQVLNETYSLVRRMLDDNGPLFAEDIADELKLGVYKEDEPYSWLDCVIHADNPRDFIMRVHPPLHRKDHSSYASVTGRINGFYAWQSFGIQFTNVPDALTDVIGNGLVVESHGRSLDAKLVYTHDVSLQYFVMLRSKVEKDTIVVDWSLYRDWDFVKEMMEKQGNAFRFHREGFNCGWVREWE